MCPASLRDNWSYSTRVMQQKAEILKISQTDNVLTVLEAPISITKQAELWVNKCSLAWRLVMYIYIYIYVPCGGSTVYIQAVLNARREGAMEEGDGSVGSGLQRPQGEPCQVVNTTEHRVYTHLHTHSWHLHWGWLMWGSLVVSTATVSTVSTTNLQMRNSGLNIGRLLYCSRSSRWEHLPSWDQLDLLSRA